jgi:hypothetical protein
VYFSFLVGLLELVCGKTIFILFLNVSDWILQFCLNKCLQNKLSFNFKETVIVIV